MVLQTSNVSNVGTHNDTEVTLQEKKREEEKKRINHRSIDFCLTNKILQFFIRSEDVDGLGTVSFARIEK